MASCLYCVLAAARGSSVLFISPDRPDCSSDKPTGLQTYLSCSRSQTISSDWPPVGVEPEPPRSLGDTLQIQISKTGQRKRRKRRRRSVCWCEGLDNNGKKGSRISLRFSSEIKIMAFKALGLKKKKKSMCRVSRDLKDSSCWRK